MAQLLEACIRNWLCKKHGKILVIVEWYLC